MPKYVVDRVAADNGTLMGKNVLVVGVAYKPNVADIRETPSKILIDELRNRGAVVTWHDDLVHYWRNEKSSPLSGADITIVTLLHSSVKVSEIISSAPYVFDTTGKIKEVQSL